MANEGTEDQRREDYENSFLKGLVEVLELQGPEAKKELMMKIIGELKPEDVKELKGLIAPIQDIMQTQAGGYNLAESVKDWWQNEGYRLGQKPIFVIKAERLLGEVF